MKKVLLISLVFVFLGILVLTLILDIEKITPENIPTEEEIRNEENFRSKEDSNNIYDDPSSKETNEDKPLEDYSNEFDREYAPGSGSGDSSNNQESNVDSDSDPTPGGSASCTAQISYAVGTIIEQKTDEGINCSILVRNLEYETSGEFTISLFLVDENSNKVESINLSEVIGPRNETEFKNFFSEASHSNRCRYGTISIPRKNIC